MKQGVVRWGIAIVAVLITGLMSQRVSAQNAGNPPVASGTPGVYNVKDYGAAGDGQTVDSPAINRAIEAAAAAGGGTVYFPAGTYLSFSLRLKSHIGLYLDHGAVLLAADPQKTEGGYDPPEPNQWDAYQDFGHSHWHNSLIRGENLEHISIEGPGMIDGQGLRRWDPKEAGQANKAIALKRCRNVTIRDITISMGGHFGILATGTDILTIDNLKIDTNRDGINIDGCHNVRISNCTVNAPNDDAIVIKSSYALGEARAAENITITNCQVSGYDPGTLLDGTYGTAQKQAPDRDGPTGRIKCGTESNGGFKNITISNCVFRHCRGLALEIVDGGRLEDVSISNITMRDIVNAPVFIRLGNRARGPEGTPVGTVRRVNISNVTVYDADPRYASIISGIPGHPVEDVRLHNIRVVSRGGLSLDQVAQQPADLVNTFFFRDQGGPQPREPFETPERADGYPEPSMFGLLPAYGLYARHVRGLSVDDVDISFLQEDRRPAFVLKDVEQADFFRTQAQKAAGIPTFKLMGVRDFSVSQSRPVKDIRLDSVQDREL